MWFEHVVCVVVWYMYIHVHMYGMLVGNNTGTQVVYCLWSCTGGTHKIFLPSCNTVQVCGTDNQYSFVVFV
jgi:hypothetical protein